LVVGAKESNNESLLTSLGLDLNNIVGAAGGRHVSFLLRRFPHLTGLSLGHNYRFGPLGARALASGIAAASHLEELRINSCGLGNDGVSNLVPEGQVNRSLTTLDLIDNDVQGTLGGENVFALAARCTNLDRIDLEVDRILNPDQQRRLGWLLERKRLCNAAQALAGSTFSVLFRFVEEQAHGHAHGLGAIFIILKNDGEYHFCSANNRTVQNN
jgi:Leucine Rich repeat